MDDTKDTKDIKETGEAASVLSVDEQMIQDGFNALLNDYLKSNHRRKVERITKAFNFANQAHAGVKRRSGEPYIMHPIAVARIVCREMGLGSTSICSALLHDVVEDTEYTVEDIRDMFGDKIAQIVDGLTKISGGIFGEQASAQAENFRKLLLTMSDDIRVILIKIADRLAAEDIQVYEIRPGVIDTDMTKVVHEKYSKLIEEGVFPIARWGTPEDIAGAVSAFCTDKFIYSTGNYIDLDGGFHIKKL